MQQIMQVVSIAQSAAVSASLHRVDLRLKDIEGRLGTIEQRLTKMARNTNLVAAAMRDSPINRLETARMTAKIAFEKHNEGALIAAARDAMCASRDILGQAKHLVRTEEDGLPVALQVPQELLDLLASVADAFEVASAILVALARPDLAVDLLKEAVAALGGMRQRMAACFDDPERLLRRSKIDATLDSLQVAVGQELRDALHRCLGRQVLIELGAIGPDPLRAEFETATGQEDLAFQSVFERPATEEGRRG